MSSAELLQMAMEREIYLLICSCICNDIDAHMYTYKGGMCTYIASITMIV